MRTSLALAAILLSAGPVAAGPVIFGEYVEARTCDVWTGPCFSNSEANTTGEMAILGWAVRTGHWDGQDLDGLNIAVAVRAAGTLSTENEGAIRAVVFLDEKASEAQGKALLSMARTLAGKYLKNIVDVRRSAIAYAREGEEATLQVGETARVRTRALNLCCDAHCGNEQVAYPALSATNHLSCAKSIEHYFVGSGLDARWSDPMKRSAMLGEFSL